MALRGPGAHALSKRTGGDQDAVPFETSEWEKVEGRAERVIAFIESLRMTRDKYAGKPFLLREWQKKAVRNLFVEGPDGKRLVREALLTIARKNGKSEIASALCLVFLVGPEAVQRGEVYAAAQDKNLAGRIFENLEAFIKSDPDLWNRTNIKRFEKSIEVLHGHGEGSYYKTLSADESKGHGLNPIFVVMDELAQWKSRMLYDNIMTGFGARDEPLALVISTKSSDAHSVMGEVTRRAYQVRDGVVDDPTFAPIIYEVPDDTPDIWDESLWPLANPALGDFRSLAEMRQYSIKARRMPGLELSFRRLYLNQTVDDAERVLPPGEWKACHGPVDADSLLGKPCWGGLDLSANRDLTAFVMWFPDPGEVLARFWLPSEGLEDKATVDGVPYLEWRANGLLSVTPGRVISKAAVALELAEIASAYDIRGIAYDTWRIAEFMQTCDDLGLEMLTSVLQPWGQNYNAMSPAIERLETLVLGRQIRHDNPILTWCVANAKATRNSANDRKLDKVKSTGRIDGMVAMTMAVGLHAVTAPEDDAALPFKGMISGLLSDDVQADERRAVARETAA